MNDIIYRRGFKEVQGSFNERLHFIRAGLSRAQIIDRTCSGIVAASASCGFLFSALSYWLVSVPISSMCQDVEKAGFKAFESLIPNATQRVINGSASILYLSSPITAFCKNLNTSGLGAFAHLLPQDLTELLPTGCYFSNQIAPFFQRINETGFAAFETIGSLELKRHLLGGCYLVDSVRPYMPIPIIVAAAVTAYYAYRCFCPNRILREPSVTRFVHDTDDGDIYYDEKPTNHYKTH